MKFTSVNKKLNLAIISVSFISLAVSSGILFWYAHKTKIEIYENVRTELITQSEQQIKAKMDVGITNAYSIANDARIKQSYITKNREYAIDALEQISRDMKENTEFNNVKIHLHTKDNKSFLRVWDQTHYGDDLSSFRKAVVEVNNNFKPIVAFEGGKAGLLLRAIVPIMDDKQHYGSLEFIQGMNSTADYFDKKQVGFLLLMDEKVQENITKTTKKEQSDRFIFNSYIVSQKVINKSFLADLQTVDPKKLFSNQYTVDSKYFYTFEDIKDFRGKKIGVVVLSKPIEVVNSLIVRQNNLIFMALFGILVMAIMISLVVIFAIRKLVVKPLAVFEKALLDFFLFLQGKKEQVVGIEINSNDEFGIMAKSLRENIAVSARLHEEIKDLNLNLKEKIEQKTKKISILLDNAGQGFLTFDKNFIIDDEYSKECIKLIGEEIGGKHIAKLLFADKLKQEFFTTTLLEALYETMLLKQNSYLSLLPQMILYNKKVMKLEYKILENEYFMLILTNITSQRKLESKMKKEQETFKMIVAIVSESSTFFDLKKDYSAFLNNYRTLVDISQPPKYNIGEVYRAIHTFKGSFSQIFMQNVVTFLHNLETRISLMIKKGDVTNEELLNLLDSVDFDASLNESLKIIDEILGEEFLHSQDFLKINLSNILSIQDKISKILDKVDSTSPECQDILCHVQNLSNIKLVDLLRPYNKLVQQLATKFSKEIYEFDITGDSQILVTDEIKPFIKSLIHLFRNSVDHGIEPAEERAELEKDEVGTIRCEINLDRDNLHIIIKDDGAGIDIEKIKNKAASLNIDINKLNEIEILNLIFEDGFSTKERVNEISGRGIGMAAVKSELDKIGGVIDMKSQKNVGTTFEFIIPMQGR